LLGIIQHECLGEWSIDENITHYVWSVPNHLIAMISDTYDSEEKALTALIKLIWYHDNNLEQKKIIEYLN